MTKKGPHFIPYNSPSLNQQLDQVGTLCAICAMTAKQQLIVTHASMHTWRELRKQARIANDTHVQTTNVHIVYTPLSDVKKSLFKESSPQNIGPPKELLYLMNRALKESNHKAFMGPWGPMGARWGHGAHMGPLGPWATGVGDHSPRAQGSVIAARHRCFKELRVLCREYRDSLTSEKIVYTLVGSTEHKQTLENQQPRFALVSEIKF